MLHIVTAVSNPLRWESRIRLARDAITDWVAGGVPVTVVECAYGGHKHELADLKGITHVPVRARTFAWNKECLLNLGIARLPESAAYVATLDADIFFRKRSWAADAVDQLQFYPVVQPWSDCYDLGPNGEHMQAHRSFGRQSWHGEPVVQPYGQKVWKWEGGYAEFAHPGYAWCWTRKFLDQVGGLIEVSAVGSGDHHMSLGIVGKAGHALGLSNNSAYAAHILRWQDRALDAGGKKLGFVWGTIEHAFHGRKAARGYRERWAMFVEHGFDPDVDLKRNSYGVLEFAGNKPALEVAFHRYLVERQEDINTL